MDKEIQSLLLTWEEYNQTRQGAPYIICIGRAAKLLTYFGANHTHDPSHEQFVRLEENWEKFVQFDSEKKVAIGEGSRTRPVFATKEESIREKGEQGYLRYLANEAGIEVAYPDPDERSIWNKCTSNFSRDEIFYHDAIQTAHQWNRTEKTLSFQEYYEPYLQAYGKESGWTEYEFSISHVRNLHTSFFGNYFDESDSDFFYNLLNPSRFATRFNELGREMDVVRDTAVVTEIVNRWRDGHSIFIVFGFSHAVIQEPAIRKFLTE